MLRVEQCFLKTFSWERFFSKAPVKVGLKVLLV